VIYVLDACALIAFLNDEDGAELVADILSRADDGRAYVYMSCIQVIEVYYDRIYVKGRKYADTFLAALYNSPVKIIHQVSRVVIREAGKLKTNYRLSLADAIGLATAIELSAQFVSSDHSELEEVERKEQIPLLWLPPRPKKQPPR
jgi:predicted nucleic acid-binding protein